MNRPRIYGVPRDKATAALTRRLERAAARACVDAGVLDVLQLLAQPGAGGVPWSNVRSPALVNAVPWLLRLKLIRVRRRENEPVELVARKRALRAFLKGEQA